ncbi:MAG: TOBE domain-containing protein, partial [Dongiaceae bacterium]
THDQGEALSMSDRVAVFNQGRIEQIGTPTEVYEHPASAFVAGFVGISNLLDGATAAAITGQGGAFSIRPEKISMAPPGGAVPDDCYGVEGRVESVLYLGASTRYHVALASGGELTVIDQNRESASGDGWRQQGGGVRLIWQRVHSQRIGSRP